jgi:hypothetical protein
MLFHDGKVVLAMSITLRSIAWASHA